VPTYLSSSVVEESEAEESKHYRSPSEAEESEAEELFSHSHN
jgi:hypothetical protein